LNHPHATTAAAGGRLDQDRVTDPLRRGQGIGLRRELEGLKSRHTDSLDHTLGRQLVADAPDRRRRRAHPGQTGVDHSLRETGVLRQEAVARMHRVRAAAPARVEHLVDVQIGVRRTPPLQRDRDVGFLDEGRAGVAVGIDRHRADAHAMRGAKDAAGDLAAVGDQQPPDGFDAHIRHVPNSLVPWMALL
jgi:hypothetical protein